MPRLILELSPAQVEDFHQFALNHPKIDSFQKINNHFLLNLICREEEYSALLQGIQEAFSLLSFREFCQAKCRDQTDCLNSAKYGKYCWRHQSQSPP